MQLPKTPSFRLDGRRALVAGASSGIGMGCAVALAEAGLCVSMTISDPLIFYPDRRGGLQRIYWTHALSSSCIREVDTLASTRLSPKTPTGRSGCDARVTVYGTGF